MPDVKEKRQSTSTERARGRGQLVEETEMPMNRRGDAQPQCPCQSARARRTGAGDTGGRG